MNKHTPPKAPTTITRRIGSNRGKARLWIEGPALTSQKWTPGKDFVPVWEMGKITYAADLNRSMNVNRRVAGTTGRPIIDTNTDKILDYLEAEIGDTVTITITEEALTITKA